MHQKLNSMIKNIGKRLKKVVGIYSIKCLATNNIYIGSTVNIQERWRQHLTALRKGKHHSVYLQRSYNKYGEDNLQFTLLVELKDYTEERLRELEWFYIDKYKPKFNSASPVVYEMSDTWKKKISESTKLLYIEKGYTNPRKDVGHRYNAIKEDGTFIAIDLPIKPLCEAISYNIASYRNINTSIRNNKGFFYYKNKNILVYESSHSLKEIVDVFKTTNIAKTMPLKIDSEYYYNHNRIYSNEIMSNLRKNILASNTLQITFDNKIITLPFICRVIE